MNTSRLLLEMLIILLLMLLNGLFAMSELAVVSARRSRLQELALSGNRGAQTALSLADSPNRFLSTVQLGITLIGILAGAFGGATLAGELAALLRQVPVLVPYAGALSLALVVGGTTLLSVVVGELVPKRIALGSAVRVAVLVSRPMQALSVAVGPVVGLLGAITDGVLTLLGVESEPRTAVSEEEIKVLIEQGAQAGSIQRVERDMVESIFRLDDRSLDGMMTPRPEIVWLDASLSEDELRQMVTASSHSRFPVCDGDLDHVLGVVRAKDLLSDCLSGRHPDLHELMQEPLFMPESVRALQALERFRQTGMHMALLVDEYGGIEGLVTLIDILEAIVGDIPTADELRDPLITQREDGSWLVDGLVGVDDFKQAFEIRALPGEVKYNTLAGFVVMMLGRLPITGDHFGWGGFRFEVADMDGNRVDKVLIQAAPEEL